MKLCRPGSSPGPRLTAMLCAMLAFGCTAPVDRQSAPHAHFDGVYEGTRTPVSGGSECGVQEAVGFEVSGNHIWLRTHRKHHYVDGTIDPEGQLSMTTENGDHQITGSIMGNHLTGTETTVPGRPKHALAPSGDVCLAQIDAQRGVPGGESPAD